MIRPELRQLIEQLTRERGGEWGFNHSRRLLRTIEVIGAGLEYDEEVVWIAAYLHDWGAYSPWAKEGVDHAQRSRQVAEEFLLREGYPREKMACVLECIETHHSGSPERSVEAILISDADGLDFLGVTGVLRDFAKNPRNLRAGFDSVRGRVEKVPRLILLDSSKALLRTRLKRTARILAEFEEETAGLF